VDLIIEKRLDHEGSDLTKGLIHSCMHNLMTLLEGGRN
jgi:hypothetical protein